MNSEAGLGLANYEVTSIEHSGRVERITAIPAIDRLPGCQSEKLRSKGRYEIGWPTAARGLPWSPTACKAMILW
jgi:hypothetical protein